MFSRVIAAFAAAVSVATGSLAQTQAPPPVEAFSRHPQIAVPVISPDGRRIAMLSQAGGRQIVTVLSRDGEPPAGANVSDVRVSRLFWASDRMLIIVASVARDNGQWGADDYTTMYALDLERPDRLRDLPGVALGVVPETGDLVIGGRRDGGAGLAAMNPETGLERTIARSDGRYFGYALDASGTPVARLRYNVVTSEYGLETRSGEYWTTVQERTEPQLTTSMWGIMAGAPDELVFTDRPNEGGRRLYSVSLATGEPVRVLFQDDEFDLTTPLFDYYTNTVLGARIDREMPTYVWFDEGMTNIQVSLEAAIPDAYVSIFSWSRDRTQFTVAAYRENRPTEYFLFDATVMSLASLGNAFPELANSVLPQRLSIRYRASDGTSIPAYLTLPDGDGPHPLVVLPHGGPAARDTGGFDYLAHFLASRGYLVLQPNYRGSSGYGVAWEQAGWGEWGRGVMQSDLTDGMNAMVRAGYAAEGRACIVGASYGGYAALAAATFTPDAFQCAAAIAPVTDLWEIARNADLWGGYQSPYSRLLASRLTGTEELPDRDQADHISPAEHADAVQIPVLLIHGREDSVVDDEHSDIMNRALERAGKDVTYIHERELDHWLTGPSMRELVLRNVETFLAEHLGE